MPSGKWENIAYAVYGFLTGKIISICKDKPLQISVPGFLKKHINFFRDTIGLYKGKMYEFNKNVVEKPTLAKELNLEKNPLVRFQNKVFDTDKVGNFYKRELSQFQYEFLRNIFLIRQENKPFCLILPKNKAHVLLAKEYLDKKEYRFSSLLTIVYLATGVFSVFVGIAFALRIKPARRKYEEGLILRQLMNGFGDGRKGFQDNFLVDGNLIHESDYIFYKSRNNESGRILAYKQAKERNYKIIVLDSSFNIDRCFLKHLKNNIFFSGLYLFQALCNSPYLLPYLGVFLSNSSDSYRLFSFCKVSNYHSVEDYGDIVKTIVANQLGIKVFLYHWSDITVFPAANHQFIAHHDLFVWGPIMKNYQYRYSKCDNVYCIGCNFSNSYNEMSKEELRERLKLRMDRSVVTFYTSSPGGDNSPLSKEVNEDFLETAINFAKKNPNIQTIIRPKGRSSIINPKELESASKKYDIKIFYSDEVFISDIIRASDVNVSLAMNSTTTISLLCNVPGIYYDKTENHTHPLSKYEGKLVFRDREKLFKQIDGSIKGKIKTQRVPELKEYNVPDADPVDIIRRYIRYGKVDEIYRFK